MRPSQLNCSFGCSFSWCPCCFNHCYIWLAYYVHHLPRQALRQWSFKFGIERFRRSSFARASSLSHSLSLSLSIHCSLHFVFFCRGQGSPAQAMGRAVGAADKRELHSCNSGFARSQHEAALPQLLRHPAMVSESPDGSWTGLSVLPPLRGLVRPHRPIRPSELGGAAEEAPRVAERGLACQRLVQEARRQQDDADRPE